MKILPLAMRMQRHHTCRLRVSPATRTRDRLLQTHALVSCQAGGTGYDSVCPMLHAEPLGTPQQGIRKDNLQGNGSLQLVGCSGGFEPQGCQ